MITPTDAGDRVLPQHATGDRMERRPEALYDRAGTDDGDGTVIERKWMRWRTFNRFVDRANALSGAADAAFLSRVARLRYGSAEDRLRDIDA